MNACGNLRSLCDFTLRGLVHLLLQLLDLVMQCLQRCLKLRFHRSNLVLKLLAQALFGLGNDLDMIFLCLFLGLYLLALDPGFEIFDRLSVCHPEPVDLCFFGFLFHIVSLERIFSSFSTSIGVHHLLMPMGCSAFGSISLGLKSLVLTLELRDHVGF